MEAGYICMIVSVDVLPFPTILSSVMKNSCISAKSFPLVSGMKKNRIGVPSNNNPPAMKNTP